MKKYAIFTFFLGVISLLIILPIFLKKTSDFYLLLNSNQYYIEQSEYHESVTFELDLTKPQSEIGKIISIDNGCYLEIVSLAFIDTNEQYEIVFNSIGNTIKDINVIYTGNYYVKDGDKTFIETHTNFVSNDDENWYPSSWSGFSESGDSFGFSIDADKVKNKEKCSIEILNLNCIKFNKKH